MRPNAVPVTLAIGGILLIAACDRAPQSQSTATPPAATPAAPSTVAEEGDPLALIIANPNPINVCGQEKKVTSVVIDWDLSKTKIRNYHVWVEAPTQPRKLWFSSFKPTGSKKTGNWVRANTTFTITTSDGKLIKSVVVGSSACT